MLMRSVSWTRQGTPTPVSPDFNNLQSQWQTLSPTGVQLSAYSASASGLSPPACPSSTTGGWTVDPSAPLPTLGDAGVTAGMPSGVPQGNITVSGAAASGTASGTGAAAGSAASSSASAHSAAGQTNFDVLMSGETGFMGMMVALMTVGAAFVWWL